MNDPYDASTGARFGKYHIVRKLGEGAFGSVYEALLPGPMGFTKRVAIKKLRSRLIRDDPKFIKSMVNEARIGGLLHHANIVDVLEFDQVGSHYYIAMELVDGGTLTQVVQACRSRGVPIPRFAILDLAAQICRGLHYAHGLKDLDGRPLDLIHRDLKPSNVIVDRHGVAKICDFGIAKAASNLGLTTHSAVVKGTPRYMSPEQISGEGALTPASDIFALGSIFYELITGNPLFRASSFHQLAFKIVEVRIGDAPSAAETAFPGFGPILEKTLSRDPAQRYSDARELADDLRMLGQNYPARADMADVMLRVLPSIDQTGSRVIKSTGDFEHDTEGSTRLWSGDASDTVDPAVPLEALDADASGWDRFTAAFEYPDLGDVSGGSQGPPTDAVSKTEAPTAPVDPAEPPPPPQAPSIEQGSGGAVSAPIETAAPTTPPGDDLAAQVRRNRRSSVALLVLMGLLAVLVSIDLLPRVTTLLKPAAEQEAPRSTLPGMVAADGPAVGDGANEPSTSSSGGGSAEADTESDIDGSEAAIGADDAVVAERSIAPTPAQDVVEATPQVPPPGPTDVGAANEPEPAPVADATIPAAEVEPEVAQPTPSEEPESAPPLTIEMVRSPPHATAGFTEEFVVRLSAEAEAEVAMVLIVASGEGQFQYLRHKGGGLWSADMHFTSEMVGTARYYFWAQRAGDSNSRVNLGSASQPFSLQVY